MLFTFFLFIYLSPKYQEYLEHCTSVNSFFFLFFFLPFFSSFKQRAL